MWRAGSLALTPPHIGTTPYTLSNAERERERERNALSHFVYVTHTHTHTHMCLKIWPGKWDNLPEWSAVQ